MVITTGAGSMYRQVEISELRRFVSYCCETGLLTRTAPAGNKKAGTSAARTTPQGYLMCSVLGVVVPAHRVAWALHYGRWPAHQIDHINGVKDDNRIANLRDVTRSVNKQNMRAARRDSRSGLIGALWRGDRRTWQAEIRVAGKQYRLGSFKTAKAAHEAYLAAKRTLHEGCTL